MPTAHALSAARALVRLEADGRVTLAIMLDREDLESPIATYNAAVLQIAEIVDRAGVATVSSERS